MMNFLQQNKNSNVVGIDLFCGAGGLTLGALQSGIDVRLGIDQDKHALRTYKSNFPDISIINDDIRNVTSFEIDDKGKRKILFGGLPCQGYSNSNKKTSNRQNPRNWLFLEFIRLIKYWNPDWIVIENVKGILTLDKGFFANEIIKKISELDYLVNTTILNATDFGVPQYRTRFFLVASRNSLNYKFPDPTTNAKVTVNEAISDLPILSNGASVDFLNYPEFISSSYAQDLRLGKNGCRGNIVSNNSAEVVERYKHIHQGGNWRDIPDQLMMNYHNHKRCHTNIYRRLDGEKPSVVINNFRKSMLIHPTQNRGLSIREAARIQSFPDWFNFEGSIGFQQQQVCDAVPPKFGAAIFRSIVDTQL